MHQDVGVANTNDAVADVSGVYLAQETPNQFNFDPAVSLPPSGTCTIYTYSGDLTLNSGFPPGLPPSKPTGRALDAGLVALARGTELALQYNATTAMTFFGAAVPTLNAAQSYLILNPGDFTLLAAGGGDVGAIQAPVIMPAPLAWTNRDQLQNIARSQGFTANWNAVPTGHSVFLSGLATDLPTNATAVFVCVAKPGDSSLTAPPYV